MKRQLKDQKNGLTYWFWSTVNAIVLRLHFRRIEVVGRENIPKNGPFLLISNHTSRYDGLLVYHLIGRPANFMVSPNELSGFQGKVLMSMGSFPANPRFDLQGHIKRQTDKGEGIVIFPEGDIHRDGTTHPFKNGAAKIALNCLTQGLKFPVIPMAIRYDDEGRIARVVIAPPVEPNQYVSSYAVQPSETIKALSVRLHREVCHLRYVLGSKTEKQLLFHKNSAHFATALPAESEKPTLAQAG